MAASLSLESQGFVRFASRASKELQRWFEPHCNNNPDKLALMTSREWDGMGDLERKPFIESDRMAKTGPYIKFLLHKRYSATVQAQDGNDEAFSPKFAKLHSQEWNSIPNTRKKYFSTIDTSEFGMDYVIENRDKLHQLYEPKKLSILEFISKTRPRRPYGPRMWFYRNECHSILSSEANSRWTNLSDEERGVYERCAVVDSKRYQFEKNAWITKLLTIDYDEDTFTFKDFEISGSKSRIESLGSLVEVCRDLPALVKLKRPRNPFSLFIEAYRYQIRDERPEFQFARHLRECSEAWSKLSDEEKEFYKNESKKLKDKRKALLANEPKADSRLTIPVDLFDTTRAVHGPCKPSHLYPTTPCLVTFWAEENGINKRFRQSLWNSLPEEEKELYMRKHAELKLANSKKKLEIEQKHKYIKQLMKDAEKLVGIKRDLRLMSRAVKNSYI